MNSQKINIIKSEDAVSETIGYSFILGIVVVAVGIMVVAAYPILSSIQDTALMEAESEALTMLSGRMNMVALGATPSQVTRMDLNGGTMNVYNTTGNRLSIVVANETGYQVEIFNKSLGKVEYAVNDNIIAFENGGMFRKYPSGDPVMMTPPEFHYNGETLTFPILRINNAASAGGKGVISIYSTSADPPRRIYPNLTSSTFINPLIGKQIRIRLKSDYYKAWAKYIEERTEVVPLANDIDHEVLVSFNSKPSDEPTDLKMPIEIVGIDTTNSTPLNKFMFNLSDVDASFHMVLRAPLQNSNELVVEMQKNGGLGPAGMTIWVSYNKDGYNESWKTDTLAVINGDITSIDLLNSSVSSYYDTNDASGTWVNESSYSGIYIKSGNNGPVPLDFVLQHYIKLVSSTGTFAIYNSSKPNEWKGFNPTNSTFALDYDIIPPTISYMQIVDHSVNVSFY
ncbi:MAG: hypothetical protein OIN66_04445 [Candidatus Methanoperedens sp.]|nr:hypothetical protein [Candidatus Methanoperedens sp.]